MRGVIQYFSCGEVTRPQTSADISYQRQVANDKWLSTQLVINPPTPGQRGMDVRGGMCELRSVAPWSLRCREGAGQHQKDHSQCDTQKSHILIE